MMQAWTQPSEGSQPDSITPGQDEGLVTHDSQGILQAESGKCVLKCVNTGQDGHCCP
jgi:hypothetical protein